MFSTIAVGTDGSATASEAVQVAADLARRFDAALVLLSAFKKGDRSASAEAVELQWASSSAARVREVLNRAEAALKEQGLDCATRVDEGDAAEVLVRLAGECRADLLVIGNKGMQRRMLGSVPNSVAHNAPCSVLVVKTT